jgi:SAM-dependent methyltransferase
MSEIPYIGNELELFAHAKNWKNYFGEVLRPYFGRKVLEVGAGLGGTTAALCNGKQDKWVCLEPDPALFDQLAARIETGQLPPCCQAYKGVTTDLPAEDKYDTIMYIDVIEHIEKDGDELSVAKRLLADNGHLIVLVPANQFLYSPFDKAIGHYRRYNRKMLLHAAPQGLRLKKMIYLDSAGFMASVVNKLFLRQSYPTLPQVRMWDNALIPLSRVADMITFHTMGKSLIAIWENR